MASRVFWMRVSAMIPIHLAVIALKLKEVFGLDDINDLPIIYNIMVRAKSCYRSSGSALYLPGVEEYPPWPYIHFRHFSARMLQGLGRELRHCRVSIVEEDMEKFSVLTHK
ncbi:MAG: hypothetical protein ACLU6F_00835 [[Ruminococcus] torques]